MYRDPIAQRHREQWVALENQTVSRERHWETERQRDRDRQTETKRETERQTQRETERERERVL